MEKKIYGAPEVKISEVKCDVITQSYYETDEWFGPSIEEDDNQ